MGIFNREKKVKEEIQEEPKIIEVGLKVLQTEQGFFGVYQMQTGDEILLAETKEKAERAKGRLENLISWNRPEDVYFMILSGETEYEVFTVMNKIIDYYDMRTEEGNIDEWLTHSQSSNGIYYMVEDDNERQYEVSGEFIIDGLAIHQEKSGIWTIDHIPTAVMMTEMPNYESARQLAEYMSKLIRWGEREVVLLFNETPDFRDYLSMTKKAVLNGLPIPSLPEKLSYKLEFFHIQNERTDFSRFNKAIDQLTGMTGLDVFKKQVFKLIYSLAGREKNAENIKQIKPNIHMAFMGPAGTGKTEMARIMSEIFASLGYLEKGHLIEVDRSQLVAQHIGKTAPKVKEAVKKALGGTLFIDEAYSLVGDEQDFGPEAIATLIKEMEDHKGEFMVILAGYQADMEKLINSNEGFRSRIKQHFHFYDYTPEQVAVIIQNILVHKGYICPDEVVTEISRAVKAKSKQGKVDGNARTARNIAEDIEEELNIRIGKDREQQFKNTRMINVDDVKIATDKLAQNQNRKELESIKTSASEKLQNLIGLHDLKIEVQRILNTIVIDNLRFQNGLSPEKTKMHMVFYGPPGTGKTTVARIMGEFLKGAGVLSNGHFIEASRSDLVAGYIGQTALKTKDLIAKAMGGILFIDEAYSLASDDKSSFGKEALDTLIKEMEDHADNLVVILAGYRNEMDKLMNLNEGLRSRIPYHFDFPHYSAAELYEMALIQLKQRDTLIPSEEASKSLQLYIHRKVEENNGYIDGDGRWIRNITQEIRTNQANRLSLFNQSDITFEQLQEVNISDIPKD